MKIAFNTNYIKDMLKHCKDMVIFKQTSPINPIICECKEFDGLDLVLPIRINC
jgi:DNA polymerase III sliding clamp (beta) subunit (PCNA family)